jgi:hypothetical protein
MGKTAYKTHEYRLWEICLDRDFLVKQMGTATHERVYIIVKAFYPL